VDEGRIEAAVESKEHQRLRKTARDSVIERFDLSRVALPAYLDLLQRMRCQPTQA
jgi:hypothetical protein